MYTHKNAARILWKDSRAMEILSSMRWPIKLMRFEWSSIKCLQHPLLPCSTINKSINLSMLFAENAPCSEFHRIASYSLTSSSKSEITPSLTSAPSALAIVPSFQSMYVLIECLPGRWLSRSNQQIFLTIRTQQEITKRINEPIRLYVSCEAKRNWVHHNQEKRRFWVTQSMMKVMTSKYNLAPGSAAGKYSKFSMKNQTVTA